MTWLSHAWPQIGDLLLAHVRLSWPPVVLSLLIAVPLGRLAQQRPRLGGVVLSAAGLLYAIPALPLLILLPAVRGWPMRTPATVVTALTLYGVALLVRTSADAFATVPSSALLAAEAVGYSPWQRWWRIELPLATPVIIAGARVVTVSTVGLATIGALIGVPSLGTLFTDGFQRGIAAAVVTGIIATVALSLLLGAAVLFLGRAMTPWLVAERRAGEPFAPRAVRGRRVPLTSRR